MNLGVIGKELNKITADGGLTNSQVSNEFFYDPNSAFGKVMAILEKIFQKFTQWWADGTRAVKRKMTEAKMELGKMFGTETIHVAAPNLFINLCVDDGRITYTYFKQKFGEIQTAFNNLVNYASTGYYDGANATFIESKMANAVTDATESLKKLQRLVDAISDGPKQVMEVGGDDIRQLDKILGHLTSTDFSAGIGKVDYVGDFKKVFDRISSQIGEEEAVRIAGDIADAQKSVIKVLEQGSKLMVQVVGTIAAVSSALANKASTEDFDVGDHVEPLIIDESPSNQLFKDLGTISTEAMMMGNISKYFGRKVDNLSVSIQEGFKYLTTYNYDPMETLHPSNLATFTSSLDFLEHDSLSVAQPNGLKGEILPLTAMLVDHAKIMQKVLTEVIRPATSRFGHYLTIPFDRAERRDFEFGVHISDDRERLVAEEAKFFTGNRAAQTTLGKVFNSFSDFVESERNMQTVNTMLNGGGTEDVKKAVQALVQTSSALVRRMAEDKVTNSNEFAKMVADQLTEVGRWVEWYAAQMTRIIETNNVLYEIEKAVLKL